jgi:hypothetical protein
LQLTEDKDVLLTKLEQVTTLNEQLKEQEVKPAEEPQIESSKPDLDETQMDNLV